MLEFNATFIVAMISFVIFILIMNWIFYKPILGVIEERQKFIDDNYNDAQNSKNKADSILHEKDERLNKTLSDSRKIVSDKINEANEKSQSLTNNAKEVSKNKIAEAKRNISNEEKQTTEALKANVKDLAENISSKILGEHFHIDNVDYDIVNKVLK